ncbi:MAG: hypothetical protein ACI9EW_002440, partial [Cellvibrionaceae bacterium]
MINVIVSKAHCHRRAKHMDELTLALISCKIEL